MAAKSTRNAARKAEMAEQARKDKARAAAKICAAIKPDGRPCTNPAGWGTKRSTGRCKDHPKGATAPVAHHEMRDMATPAVGVTPAQSMQKVMELAFGQLLYASSKVSELDEADMFLPYEVDPVTGSAKVRPHHYLALQQSVMLDLARFAKLAADAGIAERITNLQEAQTAMVAKLLDAVFDEVGLNATQRKAVGPAIRKHLAVVA